MKLLRHWRDEMMTFWSRLTRRNDAEPGPILLNRRRVYILPTRAGMLFLLILLAMLLAAINYNNSLAYALTFLLGSLGIVSIFHTFRNLHGLVFHTGHPAEVFAGSTVRFPIAIENHHADRYALAIALDNHEPVITDVTSSELHWIDLLLPSQRRGWLPLPRITVTTIYPLGLFRAWSTLYFTTRALVYPAPSQERQLPLPEVEGTASGPALVRGSDDFAQLRSYHPGDSLRHIHWKAFAREQGLIVKEFGASRSPELWLSWDSTPGQDIESRLAQLCRWILDAESAGTAYGLMMPNKRVEPARGDAHRRHCLEILALHGSERVTP